MDENNKELKIELPCEYSSGDEVLTSSSENEYDDKSELLEQLVTEEQLVIDFQKEQPDEVLVLETPLPQPAEKQKQYSILNTIFRVICNPFKKFKFVK